MTGGRVLVVDDEQAMLENCERILTRAGYTVRTLANPAPLPTVVDEFQPDVVLLDLRLPGIDGMAALAVILADDQQLPVIIMTAHASVGTAIQAIREGAFEYISKPFTADHLMVVVHRAITFRRIATENRRLRQQVARESAFANFVGDSPKMCRLVEQIRKVGPSEASVLLTGESGTGKELVARCLHEASSRRSGPFVPIDCAALTESLLEAELFGHERGAFTGAVARKVGLLVSAKGGTVFLDEITESSLALQAKLLRSLEERTVRPVGSTTQMGIDVRLLAAANVDIEQAVASGEFREDLYYRLNVVHLEIPPLRERPGDVALLLHSFLDHFARTMDRPVPHVSPEAWGVLEAHRWPGNVRELRNLAHRLVVMDDDQRITLADLPPTIREWSDGEEGPVVESVADLRPWGEARDAALLQFQGRYVRRLLAAHEGNVSKAARAAGVSRRTVHRWLAELGDAGTNPRAGS